MAPSLPWGSPATLRSNLTVASPAPAQRSLEDEISRTTWEDLPIFALSYLVIFVYITLALGEYTSCRRIPVGGAAPHPGHVRAGLGGTSPGCANRSAGAPG